jgi:hypothetical protein
MGWDYVTIYGILVFCVYYMRCVVMYDTHHVVVCVHVRLQEMTWDHIMRGLVLYDERGASLEAWKYLNCTK